MSRLKKEDAPLLYELDELFLTLPYQDKLFLVDYARYLIEKYDEMTCGCRKCCFYKQL